MRVNHHESVTDRLSRVDWWAVVSLVTLGLCAFFSGYIIVALADFARRHWL